MVQYNTYILLLISVISLWFNSSIAMFSFRIFHQIKYWQLFIFVTLISAVYIHLITVRGIVGIIIFYLILQQYKHHVYIRIIKIRYMVWMLWLLIIGFALLFYLHKVPGFNNLLIINKVQFTPDAVPFTMYLNLDKTIIGVLLLGSFLTLNHNLIAWRDTIKAVAIYFPLVAIVLLGLSYWFHYVRFEPKIVDGLLYWSINNLFFVCVAEEALFRGFIQNSLSMFFNKYLNKFGYSCSHACSGITAVIIGAILFGLLHAPGGYKYVILATIAGVLYGYIYYRTQRIEASILTHFLVNFTHILLFTYPALTSAM